MLNNYNLCVKRYNALRRQLSKDPVLEKAYTEEIHKLINKDNVEKVEENSLFASDPNRYLNYLLQECEARQGKISSKVRPVFDALSHNNHGISLNDNLYQGPKTQDSIPMITANLRVKPILLVADLSQMFYSIGYSTEPEAHTKVNNNRDLYCFSWSDNKNDEPEVLRFKMLLMGARCCPFQANSTINYHLNKFIASTDNFFVTAVLKN